LTGNTDAIEECECENWNREVFRDSRSRLPVQDAGIVLLVKRVVVEPSGVCGPGSIPTTLVGLSSVTNGNIVAQTSAVQCN
jgi:hypothetical protein